MLLYYLQLYSYVYSVEAVWACCWGRALSYVFMVYQDLVCVEGRVVFVCGGLESAAEPPSLKGRAAAAVIQFLFPLWWRRLLQCHVYSIRNKNQWSLCTSRLSPSLWLWWFSCCCVTCRGFSFKAFYCRMSNMKQWNIYLHIFSIWSLSVI